MKPFEAAMVLICLCVPAFAQDVKPPEQNARLLVNLPLTEKENAEYVKITGEWQARQSDAVFAQETLANVMASARKASTPVQFKTVGEQLRQAILANDAAYLGKANAEAQFATWQTAAFKARGCSDEYTCTLDDRDPKNRFVAKAPKPKPVEAPKAEEKK